MICIDVDIPQIAETGPELRTEEQRGLTFQHVRGEASSLTSETAGERIFEQGLMLEPEASFRRGENTCSFERADIRGAFIKPSVSQPKALFACHLIGNFASQFASSITPISTQNSFLPQFVKILGSW